MPVYSGSGKLLYLFFNNLTGCIILSWLKKNSMTGQADESVIFRMMIIKQII
jgi:hypothetical protein